MKINSPKKARLRYYPQFDIYPLEWTLTDFGLIRPDNVIMSAVGWFSYCSIQVQNELSGYYFCPRGEYLAYE